MNNEWVLFAWLTAIAFISIFAGLTLIFLFDFLSGFILYYHDESFGKRILMSLVRAWYMRGFSCGRTARKKARKYMIFDP